MRAGMEAWADAIRKGNGQREGGRHPEATGETPARTGGEARFARRAGCQRFMARCGGFAVDVSASGMLKA